MDNCNVNQYKQCILALLKKVWHSSDVKMWKSIYTYIKHYIGD